MKRSGVQKLHQLFFLFLLSLITIIASCGGSGGGGGAGTTDSTNTAASQAGLSGTVQPDPASPTAANGQNAGATVYVVGQQNNSTTTDSNGNFSLNVNPALSGTVLSSPSFFSRLFKAASTVQSYGLVVISGSGTHGRKTEITVTDGSVDPINTIYINTVGTISGKAVLQGQTDHTGIRVYIPGTSFQATTDAAGNYSMSNVPSGTYDLVRADYPGTVYHFSVVARVIVTTNQTTTLPDFLLQTNVGASGSVLINNGEPFSTSISVRLAIAPSDTAVLMALSEDPNFTGTLVWEPVKATKDYTFSGSYSPGGPASIYVKFADISGLPTAGSTSDSIHIDTNPQATMLSPVSNTADTKPTLSWKYTAPIPNPAFHVRLGSSPDCTTMTVLEDHNVVAAANSDNSGQYAVQNALSNLQTYYWCVSIIDANSREWNWAGPWSFQVDLSTVNLISPANLVISNNTTTVFSWGTNPNAAYYILSYSTDSTLSSGVTSTSITAPATSKSLTFAASARTVYYWAVTPYDNNNVPGAKSGIWSFTLDTIQPVGAVITSTADYPDSTGLMLNDGNPMSVDRDLSVKLSATDTGGSGVAAYFISESASPPTPTNPNWHAISPTTSYIASGLTFTLGSANNGAKTVHVWFKDQAGNISDDYPANIGLMEFDIEVVEGGGVGPYTSLALDSMNTAYISYMDSLNSDMRYADNRTPGSWTKQYVDGVGNITGYYSSISAGPSGNQMHISYQESGVGSRLKYATNPGGTWQSEVVDPAALTGQWTAIALDSNGNVHIVYKEGMTGHFKYATGVWGAWSITDLGPGGGNGNMAIVVDSSNNVHISYYNASDKGIRYLKKTAAGVWSTSVLLDSNSGSTYGMGYFNSIATDSTGVVHISYTDWTNWPSAGRLKYATNPGGAWVTSTIDSSASVGDWNSIDVDGNNKVHIGYHDYTNGNLKYASNAFGSWGKVTIDNDPAVVGGWTSLKTDSNNKVHVSYRDEDNAALKYSHSK